MDAGYWNLFWSTGMPEAWLMSRDGPGPRQAGDASTPKEGKGRSAPLADSPSPLMSNVPGSPKNLY